MPLFVQLCSCCFCTFLNHSVNFPPIHAPLHPIHASTVPSLLFVTEDCPSTPLHSISVLLFYPLHPLAFPSVYDFLRPPSREFIPMMAKFFNEENKVNKWFDRNFNLHGITPSFYYCYNSCPSENFLVLLWRENFG